MPDDQQSRTDAQRIADALERIAPRSARVSHRSSASALPALLAIARGGGRLASAADSLAGGGHAPTAEPDADTDSGDDTRNATPAPGHV